jgi:DNA-binding MarR family transcriptional regulator
MHLMLAMLKSTYWFDDALQKALAANEVAPLTRAQSFVIRNIAVGVHRASRIAQNLGVSRQAISQILIELSNRNIISVEEDPTNPRSRIVRFSDTFAEDGEICNRIFQALEEELRRRIGDQTYRNLREALEADWGEPPAVGRLSKVNRAVFAKKKTSRTKHKSTVIKQKGPRLAARPAQ